MYDYDIECDKTQLITCDICNLNFYRQLCFDKPKRVCEVKTVACDQVCSCLNCKVIYNTTDKRKCYHSQCTNCKQLVTRDHKCFLLPIDTEGGECTQPDSCVFKKMSVVKLVLQSIFFMILRQRKMQKEKLKLVL